MPEPENYYIKLLFLYNRVLFLLSLSVPALIFVIVSVLSCCIQRGPEAVTKTWLSLRAQAAVRHPSAKSILAKNCGHS